MKPSTRTDNPPQTCPDCGNRYWSWSAHAECCVGRKHPGTSADPVGRGLAGAPTASSTRGADAVGSGPPLQPLDEVARLIADNGVFTTTDAVRVARAYLETLA